MFKEVSQKKTNYYRRDLLSAVLTVALTVLILIVIMKQRGIAPFGDSSFASQDGRIQYLDFFAYYKDVLTGKNSISYTLTSSLGMSTISIFAYYLMSPFNLLMLFFSKNNINEFFSLLVVLKIAMCGLTMSMYLNKRFLHKINWIFVVLLSLAYALMQYNFSQNLNVMWLDGVYMLPLILLGVYYVANQGKTLFLSLVVCISIIFQWYTAGINCLYSIVWFLLELCLSKQNNNLNHKELLSRTFKYLIGMLSGVLLSLFIFWPNIVAMRQGRGTFDWNSLTFGFKGNFLETILRYSVGSVSDENAVSLFCGGLVLLGIIGFFYSKQFSKSTKNIVGLILVFSIAIFYWQPLFFTYSLFKSAESYWFRYAYVSIFCLIFIAGLYFSKWNSEKNQDKLMRGAILFTVLLFLLKYTKNNKHISLLYFTAGVLVFEAAALINIKKTEKKPHLKKFFTCVLCVLTMGELYANGRLLTGKYTEKYVSYYKDYRSSTENQIDSLKEMDKGLYRVNQTETWSENSGNLTAYYNESMAYGYNGISSYTSNPQMTQLDFLERVGYRNEGNRMSIVNTSILPVDSFLGVKYILSKYPINGYSLVNSLPASDYNSKYVYLNPYALPMAYTYLDKSETESLNQDETIAENWNPFEYVNSLYSQITGKTVKVFVPIEYTSENVSDGIHYHLYNLNDNETLYCDIPSSKNENAEINVNNSYIQNYSCWLSPSVFYIPFSGTEADILVKAKKYDDFKEPQFYACNLEAMGEVSSAVQEKAVNLDKISNTEYHLHAVADKEGETLLISVPYNAGWTATVNGRKVQIDTFAGTFMKIHLSKGENEIVLHYTIPGVKAGIVGSLIGLLLLLVVNIFQKRRENLQFDRR